MPDVPAAGDAAGAAGGPSGSIPFGQGGATQALQQRLSQGPGGPRLPQQQASPHRLPGGGAPPPGPGMPVQPGPPIPGPQQAMAKSFSLQQQPPIQAPWRQRLREWANHPDAGPHLRALGHLATLDQPQGKPRGPGS